MAQLQQRVAHTTALLLGAAVIVVSQRIHGWWLDSTAGVVRTIGALLLTALFVAVWQRRRPWTAGMAVWVGAVIGMTVTLFRIGPGTIWPIVLVVGSAVAGAGVLMGVLLGRIISRLGAGSS